MSLRQAPVHPQADAVHRVTDGEVPLRVLVLGLVAAAMGAIAWRFPFTVNPMLIAVAAYAVLDRLTDRRSA